MSSYHAGASKTAVASSAVTAAAKASRPSLTVGCDNRRRMEIPWRQISEQMLDSICRALLDRNTDAPVRAIDLTDNQLGPAAAQKITACLKSSPVTEVFIRFNDIGKDGCDGLAAAVNFSHTLQVLDIRGNHLSASDVRRLLKSVAMSTVLTRLGLASNKLGPEGAALVAKALERNTYLTSLDLSVNELGQGGAQCLADLLRIPAVTLQVLQLHGNYFGANGVVAICDAVKTNKELRRLTIGNNHATDEAAAAIAAMLEGNYTLEELDLRLNSLTAVGIKTIAQNGLAKNTSLRSLILSGNQVGPVGANELTHVLSAHQRSVIEQLDLSSCGLMSTGGVRIASLLSTSISLKDVNLSDNSLDDEAAVCLAQNMADGFAISLVDVSCNEIGEEGASQLIDAALRNAQLSALVMQGNNISRVALKKMDNLLEERLSKNRVLNRHTALYQQQKLTQQQQAARANTTAASSASA
ncbi:hypothetical protein ABL78_5890 [Leptomonas seymouri]|uniref:Uncharacterized protein n=1 Tax=Leptomonas seymouri TaxID=5684 RepID=A0A0N1HUH0_LEPSE|nr:hypothetical protein ABL78_5890 [Leptomonas seymouri]|eukprot:KPI85052.1 hypothetical protein ABL78_5890 [Leptomonas seymouri]